MKRRGQVADLETLRGQAAAARVAADRATPGGLHGDPGTLSGVRRRGGHRAEARRHASYDKVTQIGLALVTAERDEVLRKAAVARKAADVAAHRDLDGLAPGDYVRDRHGWNRVTAVNAKSVTVEVPGYSWTNRIVHARIIETASGGCVS